MSKQCIYKTSQFIYAGGHERKIRFDEKVGRRRTRRVSCGSEVITEQRREWSYMYFLEKNLQAYDVSLLYS